jgi:uncharacterized peroxidase-related enzyme
VSEVAFVETVPVAEAAGDVRRMYEQNQKRLGYVPNYAKLFSLRPQVMDGWAQLQKSIKSNMDTRRFELVTLAAARALRSSYCSLAHASVLAGRFFSGAELARVACRAEDAPLSPAEAALMAFAERVAVDAHAVTREEVEELRRHGLEDTEIFDVAAAAAARCFFAKLLDALGAEPDASYEALQPELRQTLTVGRPISERSVESIPVDPSS